MKHNILLIEPTIKPNGVKLLSDNGNVTLAPSGAPEVLIRYIREHQIEAIIAREDLMTREVIAASPTLKIIGQHGIGVNNIDMEAAMEHKVKVLNVPDSSHIAVAEHAMMFVLSLSRSLRINDCSIRRNDWMSREQRCTNEIFEKTLLIVGLGRIGRALAQRAQAFDMRVTAYDAFVSKESAQQVGVQMFDTLEEGLKEADFVSLHTPLTPETTGMISTKQLKLMKESAYLINLGRGPVVDEAALIESLKAGEIAGAGLDVLEVEPPHPDNPLLQMDQVLFTPHIGGNPVEASMRTSRILANTVLQALDGEDTYNWVNRW